MNDLLNRFKVVLPFVLAGWLCYFAGLIWLWISSWYGSNDVTGRLAVGDSARAALTWVHAAISVAGLMAAFWFFLAPKRNWQAGLIALSPYILTWLLVKVIGANTSMVDPAQVFKYCTLNEVSGEVGGYFDLSPSMRGRPPPYFDPNTGKSLHSCAEAEQLGERIRTAGKFAATKLTPSTFSQVGASSDSTPHGIQEAGIASPILSSASGLTRITLLFDGRPLQLENASRVKLWIRNEGNGRPAETIIEEKHGAQFISGLAPGRYGVSVGISTTLSESRSGRPKDYAAWQTFAFSDNPPSELVVDVHKVIHLLQPIDNDLQLTSSVGGCGMNSHEQTVDLEWEPVLPGAEYSVDVALATCQPYSVVRSVATYRTSNTSVALNLPRNSPGEMYQLKVWATKNGRNVGGLEVSGANFLAWDYRFRIQ